MPLTRSTVSHPKDSKLQAYSSHILPRNCLTLEVSQILVFLVYLLVVARATSILFWSAEPKSTALRGTARLVAAKVVHRTPNIPVHRCRNTRYLSLVSGYPDDLAS